VKLLDHRDADKDESEAHDQRPDDPPEKDFVLVLLGHAKILEEDQEDEKVVDAHRLLENVAGNELQGRTTSAPEINQGGKSGCKSDPEEAPRGGLFYAHDPGLAVQHSQVEEQHKQHEEIEANPEIDRHSG